MESDHELISRIRTEFDQGPPERTQREHLARLRAPSRHLSTLEGGRSGYRLALVAAAVALLIVAAQTQLGRPTEPQEPAAAQLAVPEAETTPSTHVVTLPPTAEIEPTTTTADPGTDESTENSTSATSISTSAEFESTVGPPTTSLSATSIVIGPLCGREKVTILGTSGDDEIVGTSGDDVILAKSGNDKIFGKGGNDLICGGSGNDVIRGGDGKDRIWGGSGDDTIFGEKHDDRIWGNGDKDTLWGGGGDDELYGNGGDDRLDGQWGDDSYAGGGEAGDVCTDTTNDTSTLVDCT